jgi:hypothetical protein
MPGDQQGALALLMETAGIRSLVVGLRFANPTYKPTNLQI